MSGAALLILTAEEDLSRSGKSLSSAIQARMMFEPSTGAFTPVVEEEMAACAAQMDILRARLNALKATIEA